jgi:hypothetical protein
LDGLNSGSARGCEAGEAGAGGEILKSGHQAARSPAAWMRVPWRESRRVLGWFPHRARCIFHPPPSPARWLTSSVAKTSPWTACYTRNSVLTRPERTAERISQNIRECG